MTGNDRFCFVVPMYNASTTLERMLHSIFGQSYENWRIILIDDDSQSTERLAEDRIIKGFQRFDRSNRLTVRWNTTKRWEVANVLRGITTCDDDDIVVRCDADDWLIDLDALAILGQLYAYGCDAVWTAHRWGFSDRNISGPMAAGADPYTHPWVSSHMKTFRKRLINGVPYENFLNMDGELVRRAGDQCVYLPALVNARNRTYVPRVMYHYSIDERDGAVYRTADARFQKEEAEFIRQRGYVASGDPWEKHI